MGLSPSRSGGTRKDVLQLLLLFPPAPFFVFFLVCLCAGRKIGKISRSDPPLPVRPDCRTDADCGYNGVCHTDTGYDNQNIILPRVLSPRTSTPPPAAITLPCV